MDGTTFAKKPKLRALTAVHIALTVLTTVLLLIFTFNRLLINYANVYPTDRSDAIEYSPLYSALAIGFAVLLLFFLICALIRFDYLKQQIIVFGIGAVIVICIICGGRFALSIPESNEYSSKKANESVSQYFPIDNYKYDKKSSDFYYIKEVTIGDTYWIGSYAYKNFDNLDKVEEQAEEESPSYVFMSYYYLKDDTGRRVKDYIRNRDLFGLFYVNDYISEYREDNYKFYEYEDAYEFILTDDNEVFYLTANKNELTEYDSKDIISTAKSLMSTVANGKAGEDF